MRVDRITFDYDKFREQISRKRKKFQTVADEIGVSRQTIRNWGLNGIPCYKAWMLEEYLDCKIEDLQ